MNVKRTCAAPGCVNVFEAKRASAKYCGPTCRSRVHRAPKQDPEPAAAPAESGPLRAVPWESESPLCAAIRRRLEAADLVDSVLGQQALMLAGRLGFPADTGSAVASLSKELRAVMDAALADAPKAADALDDLAARRRRKAEGA